MNLSPPRTIVTTANAGASFRRVSYNNTKLTFNFYPPPKKKSACKPNNNSKLRHLPENNKNLLKNNKKRLAKENVIC